MLRIAQKIAERGGAGCLAKPRGELLVAQKPCNRGKRAKVLAASRWGNEQKKHEIDRLAIDRVEMDRPVETRE